MSVAGERKRRGRPRRSESEGLPVGDRIRAEAATLFATRGYDGTSVAAIAHAVGISPGALYWHFESKEHLLVSIIRIGLEEYARTIDAELAGKDAPEDQLRSWAIGHVKAIMTRQATAQAALFTRIQWTASLSPEHVEEIARLQRDQSRRLRSIIRRGSDLGVFSVPDPVAASFAITTMCDHLGEWFRTNGPLGIDAIAEMYGEFAVRIAGFRISQPAKTRRR